MWHIVVEDEKGRRETVGEPSADLGGVTARAIALADELGRIPATFPRDCRVEIVAADGRIQLSITIIAGGLDAGRGSPG